MNRLLCCLLGLAFLLLSRFCDAAVFERDWKAPGDGLLTYDDVNQREWLDLSETLLERFPGENIEARYQNAISELQPGGMFETFTVAKRADVIALAEHAGITTMTDDFNVNGTSTRNLISLLGATRTTSVGRIQSRGFLDEIWGFFEDQPVRIEAALDYRPPDLSMSFEGDAGLRYGPGDFTSPMTTGILLYRVVPEPSTCVLAVVVFASAGLMNTRRRSGLT
jgi:hypothetical protein